MEIIDDLHCVPHGFRDLEKIPLSQSLRVSFVHYLFFILMLILFQQGVAHGAPTPKATPSPSPSQSTDGNEGVSEPYASETGKFGLSMVFQYNVLESPTPIPLFQNGVGGLGELSYGISKGIRIIAGGGYMSNSPHVSPPLARYGNPSPTGPSNQYAQAYAGIKVELTRWFPSMIRYQPWFPYIRADSGGVFASISDAGSQTGHPNGLMEDLGIGIQGRPRALPMAFFGEIRQQWLFFGPQILTVVPVLAGTTFFF